MDGFFPPDGSLSHDLDHMLSWTVADMASDYINTNEAICPLMGYVRTRVKGVFAIYADRSLPNGP